MPSMRQRMELEKMYRDFVELLQRIDDLLQYYPSNTALLTIHDMLDEAIHTIDKERNHLDTISTKGSPSV